MTFYVPNGGDFGLTKIQGGVGKAIRAGQFLVDGNFADYEHAFGFVGNGNIVEAEPGGARTRPVAEYDPATVRWSSGLIPLTDSQRTAIVEALKGFAALKIPYSEADYVAIAAHHFGIPVPLLRRYIASNKHAICSQLVDMAYQSAGVKLFSDGRWNGFVMPADLDKLLNRLAKMSSTERLAYFGLAA